jgi:hypothetical protein
MRRRPQREDQPPRDRRLDAGERPGPGGPRRFARDAAIAVLGLAVGIGGAFVIRAVRDPEPQAPDRTPSVQRLALPGGPAAGPAGGPADVVTAPAGAPIRPGSPRAAVDAFLRAQVAGRQERAYALLDTAGRRRWPTAAAWADAQADRPAPTAYRVGAERPAGAAATDVSVAVAHRPGLDAFSGLTPARSDEVWRARREAGTWRVEPGPRSSVPVLAPDRGAPAAAQAWLDRLAACDDAGAARLQAVAELFGPGDLAAMACHDRGRWTAGSAGPLGDGDDPGPYVAAYGPDAQSWARVVAVRGPAGRFRVVLAPIGSTWRVLGTGRGEAGD